MKIALSAMVAVMGGFFAVHSLAFADTTAVFNTSRDRTAIIITERDAEQIYDLLNLGTYYDDGAQVKSTHFTRADRTRAFDIRCNSNKNARSPVTCMFTIYQSAATRVNPESVSAVYEASDRAEAARMAALFHVPAGHADLFISSDGNFKIPFYDAELKSPFGLYFTGKPGA